MNKLEFISTYLKYLLTLPIYSGSNVNWSLQSVSTEVENELKGVGTYYIDNIDVLINIAQFEYTEACEMTTVHIMSMEEMLSILQTNHRDKIIKEILNDK